VPSSAGKQIFFTKRLEYPLRDVYNNLKGQNVTLTLEAEIMPYVGRMYNIQLKNNTFKVPNNYL
jgi:hypothetical protein